MVAPDHNRMQTQLNDIVTHAQEHGMVLNVKKTKTMFFNASRKYDLIPKLYISNEAPLEVVESARLLGFVLTSDLKTKQNTDSITKSALGKLWLLRRLKGLGVKRCELVTVLKQQILPTLEQAVPFWGPMITQKESNQIEWVLKIALYIILGVEYIDFNQALLAVKMTSLKERRLKLTQNFAVFFSMGIPKTSHQREFFCIRK